ncbi:MAG: DNA-processing protein DprA [Bacteroidales bacterium]
MEEELKYLVALTMIPSIGPQTARKLIIYTGSAEAVFREKRQALQKIPGIGQTLAQRTSSSNLINRAEKELLFCKKNNINILDYFSDSYPARLKNCTDAPLLLLYRGEYCFSSTKVISMVGTRRASAYGTDICNQLIEDIAEFYPECVIVSGLAYGIDYQSHLAAVKNNLKTIAVMGHGLHTIYPGQHKNLAFKILKSGCICTDFFSDMNPERNNFIKRNRIIAGLADATLVIESGLKGGALITADIAGSYNRDVFTFPGRVGDEKSLGCNSLIKHNRAGLIEGLKDLEYFMGWERGNQNPAPRQKILFTELSEEEEMVIEILKDEDKISLDSLGLKLNWPISKLSSILLNLEFEGIIRTYPGNYYKLV